MLLRELAPLDDVAWLAWFATVGDLGAAHPFAHELAPIAARYRKTHVQQTVARLLRALGYSEAADAASDARGGTG